MIEIFNCQQGTDEWYRARMGIPTASMFHAVLAQGKGGGESKTRRTYMLNLAGEIITGEPMKSYSNEAMERGHIMEPEAIEFYAMASKEPITRIGFARNGDKGASPDGFVGDTGVLEIKTKQPNVFIEMMENYKKNGEFPSSHKAQCQGALWVLEREWIDLAPYWPKMPRFVMRAYRDESYIENLARNVRDFNAELAETVDWVRRNGMAA